MNNFEEYLDSLFHHIKDNDFATDEKNKIDHNIDDIEIFKNIYKDAFDKQQYIAREEKPLGLKVGIKIINSKGVNRYFISIKHVLHYLSKQKLSKKEKMQLRLEEIIKDINNDQTMTLKGLYYFSNDDVLRVIVVLDENSVSLTLGEYIEPFYFEGDGFTEAQCMIRESEWGKLRLPDGWGEYSQAIKFEIKD